MVSKLTPIATLVCIYDGVDTNNISYPITQSQALNKGLMERILLPTSIFCELRFGTTWCRCRYQGAVCSLTETHQVHAVMGLLLNCAARGWFQQFDAVRVPVELSILQRSFLALHQSKPHGSAPHNSIIFAGASHSPHSQH